MTAATKKQKASYTRRVSTKEEKLGAINAIYQACVSGTPIQDSDIKHEFHVSRSIALLLDRKWIKATSEPKVYTWNTNFTIEAIVGKLWTLHGHPKPAVADLKETVKELAKELIQQPEPPMAPPKEPLEDLVIKLLSDCEQYGITNRAQYLVDNLKLQYKIQ